MTISIFTDIYLLDSEKDKTKESESEVIHLPKAWLILKGEQIKKVRIEADVIASKLCYIEINDFTATVCETNRNKRIFDINFALISIISETVILKNNSGELTIEFDSLAEKSIWLCYLSKNCVFTNFHKSFKRIELLGRGGFSNVYSAQEIENGHEFAVKACTKRYLKSIPNGIQTIRNEIEILRKLDHFSIFPRLKQVFESENSIYLVMDLIKGTSLRKLINMNSPIVRAEKRRNILFQLYKSLDTLHSVGVVHRDIKGDNIIVDEEGKLTIIDFGLSLFTREESLASLEGGTPGFLPPEYFSQELELSSHNLLKQDVFALGIIHYMMITGKHPFEGETDVDTLHKNTKFDLDLNSTALSDITNNERTILLLELELDIEKRATCSEIMKMSILNGRLIK